MLLGTAQANSLIIVETKETAYLLFPSTCSSFLKKALINHLYSCKTAETPLQLAAHLSVSSLMQGHRGPPLVHWSFPTPPAAGGVWGGSAAPADWSLSMTETSLPPVFGGGLLPPAGEQCLAGVLRRSHSLRESDKVSSCSFGRRTQWDL